MTSLPICIAYNGSWIELDGRFEYRGSKGRGIVLSNSNTYGDLIEKIYRVTEIDRQHYDLRLSVINSPQYLPPIDIADDDDLQFYRLQIERKIASALCIEAIAKVLVSHASEQHETPFEPSPPLVGMISTHGGKTFCSSQCSNQIKGKHLNIENDNMDHGAMHEPNNNPLDDRFNYDGFDDIKEGGAVETHGGYEVSKSSHDLNKRPITSLENTMVKVENAWVPTFESTMNDTLEVDQIFSNKKELKYRLSVHAIKNNFEYKVKKSDKERLTIACIRDNCPWSLRATKLPNSEMFMIRKHFQTHTCSLLMRGRDHKQASSEVIGSMIKSKYEGVGKIYRPRDIMNDMHGEYGIKISYDKARQARENALTIVSKSFSKIPIVCPRVGHRKVNRIPSLGETRVLRSCTRCGEKGHNRQTCKNPCAGPSQT